MAFYGLPQPGLCQPENVKAPAALHFGRLDEYKGFSDADVSWRGGAGRGGPGAWPAASVGSAASVTCALAPDPTRLLCFSPPTPTPNKSLLAGGIAGCSRTTPCLARRLPTYPLLLPARSLLLHLPKP